MHGANILIKDTHYLMQCIDRYVALLMLLTVVYVEHGVIFQFGLGSGESGCLMSSVAYLTE